MFVLEDFDTKEQVRLVVCFEVEIPIVQVVEVLRRTTAWEESNLVVLSHDDKVLD